MIVNPILTGFNPDPCICRCGDDYYLAVSSFEWYPGIPIYHSRDLKNWRLLTYGIKNADILDLRRIKASNGVWAPCLSYCETDRLFYLAFTIMHSVNSGMDLCNFITSASNIEGPWEEPAYLHSAGFDPSVFHDDDGRKYIVALEWETRAGHYMPGEICLVEYDFKKRALIGEAKRILRGNTVRGWVEGPHLYKRNGWYYLLCAEGGTYYNHCAAVGRSRNIWGPYEPSPYNPLLTSRADIVPNTYENWNNGRDRYPEAGVYLQRSGHASLIETPLGELYAVHLCTRPFLPEGRSTLGRETSIQKLEWTHDDWLRMEDGDPIVKKEVPESRLSPVVWDAVENFDDFDDAELGLRYICPRIDYRTYTDLTSRSSYLRMRGQESLCSNNRVSLIAHKLTSVKASLTTKLDFTSRRYSQYAGICIYYDECNYLALRKIIDERANVQSLDILKLECGNRSEPLASLIPVGNGQIYLRVVVNEREIMFYWSHDNENYQQIGGVFDTTKYSDEYGNCGDNTGTVLGVFCVDAYRHENYADFDWFEYKRLD